MYEIWSFFELLPFFCWFWHVVALCVPCLSFWDALLVAGLHNWSSSLINLLSTGAWKRSRWELVQSPVWGNGKAVCILTQVQHLASYTHPLWFNLPQTGLEVTPQLMSAPNLRLFCSIVFAPLAADLMLSLYLYYPFELLNFRNKGLLLNVSAWVENMTLRKLALRVVAIHSRA